jgi:peroxiredoxin
MAAVAVGDMAPDFELPAVLGDKRQKFKLSDHRGANVVLAFYVLNWTPT